MQAVALTFVLLGPEARLRLTTAVAVPAATLAAGAGGPAAHVKAQMGRCADCQEYTFAQVSVLAPGWQSATCTGRRAVR